MNTITIRDIQFDKISLGTYEISGWVKTHRQSKNVCFMEISDGTSVKGLQAVIEPGLTGYAEIAAKLVTGSSVWAKGDLVKSPAKGQKYEFQVKEIKLLGEADPETYPLQKKETSFEYLREVMHFRARSNTLGAVMRVRSAAAMAVHKFYQEERGFYYIHTPIITASDCEGAGQMFNVTTFDLSKVPLVNGKPDFSSDFFKTHAHLTVSGQLEGEIFACALQKIYTFGPTFRSENSNTVRHLSEFWMIEPEMAFYDLKDNMQLAEDFFKYMINYVLEKCPEEMEFFEKFIEPGIVEAVRKVAQSKFEYLDYTDAIKILEKCDQKFEHPVSWGIDLQTEHERYLTDKHVKGPLFVVNYPKAIKSFYMRQNEDGKTVRAMDLLVPRIGEIIGGSQREERFEVLKSRIEELKMDPQDYWWYLDLRKFGTVPHAGFGLGFERFIMYITGMQNIRDVVPVPRYPGFAGF